MLVTVPRLEANAVGKAELLYDFAPLALLLLRWVGVEGCRLQHLHALLLLDAHFCQRIHFGTHYEEPFEQLRALPFLVHRILQAPLVALGSLHLNYVLDTPSG